MAACQTPGAIFHTTIGPREVTVRVELPCDNDLSSTEAAALDERLHRAVEAALAPVWSDT
jgi:hypothetical protein